MPPMALKVCVHRADKGLQAVEINADYNPAVADRDTQNEPDPRGFPIFALFFGPLLGALAVTPSIGIVALARRALLALGDRALVVKT
jgi:hypothetical protein